MGLENTMNEYAIQQSFVDDLKSKGIFENTRIENAFRTVPRHLFLPKMDIHQVYLDEAITIQKEGDVQLSSSSQPSLMATMLERLDLQSDQNVLEIGTGTGFNAALIAHLIGKKGQVTTVEIDEEVSRMAQNSLIAAGYEQVNVVCADGSLGYAPHAPYDRIILTVGAWDILPSWWEQLKPHGRLLIPLWIRGEQWCIVFERELNHLIAKSIFSGSFTRLRGSLAGPEGTVKCEGNGDLWIIAESKEDVNCNLIDNLLNEPSRILPTGIQTNTDEISKSLGLWLAIHHAHYLFLMMDVNTMKSRNLPFTYSEDDYFATWGLQSDKGLCLITFNTEFVVEGDRTNASSYELFIRVFGSDPELEKELLSLITFWSDVGRPKAEALVIKALPSSENYTLPHNEVVVRKQWTQLLFSW